MEHRLKSMPLQKRRTTHSTHLLRNRIGEARRLTTEAVFFSAALSLLFVLVYGGCNAIASQSTNAGACFFAWELEIPFVPSLIVPYLSIDLFFVASFLLCTDRLELRTHARRISLAILIAGLVFLFFPLTVGYQRPEVSGWTGWLFGLLWSFDKPHNLVPSLHVALATLLWPVYARHTQSVTRLLVHGWFTLIIASPLLTLQHHVLDVATGAMLGQFCLFVFPNYSRSRALELSKPHIRVAGFYAIGSAVLGILAISYGSWLWLLLWPAMSLTLIAIAYSRGNSSVFRKAGGRLPISTRIVLCPYLLGVYARLLLYRRRRGAWVLAAPGVYCGRLLSDREAGVLLTRGVTGVLDLTAEHAESQAFRDIEYMNVPILDLTAPSQEQLNCATSFIAKHARRGGVYVHCALGISRSAAATMAYARAIVDMPVNQAHGLITLESDAALSVSLPGTRVAGRSVRL